jgi:hypothetical protein
MMFLGIGVGLASPITYTDQFVASGSLGIASFTDALVIISFTGDTTNVTEPSTVFYNELGTATVNITGIGTATFTDVMAAFDNPLTTPPATGIGDFTLGASVLATGNSDFGSYDLQSSIGPLSGESFFRSDLTFNTSLGDFNIATGGQSTFTAVTSPVPEPASWLFLVIALAALFLKSQRMRKHGQVNQAFRFRPL